MALEIQAIADLVIAARNELGDMKVTDLSGTLQEYVAFSKLMQKESVGFNGGARIKFNVMTGDNSQAAFVGMYATDNYNRVDVLTTGTVDWRHVNTNWSIDAHEVSVARDKYEVLDVVKTQRDASQVALAKKIETAFWSKPADNTDVLTPYGIAYWLVYNSSTGFNGGAASGFSSGPAGISPTTYTAWKNFTAQYTNVTKADLIALMRQAATKCMFKSILTQGLNVPDNQNYGYYTNYTVVGLMESLAQAQNENLGPDVAQYDGGVMFRRIPISYVPQLDGNSVQTDPIYGINWNSFKTVFLRGWFMKETTPRALPNQHNVIGADQDSTFNWVCYDRRRNFLIAKS